MQVVTAHVWRLRARCAAFGAAASAVPSRWLAQRIGAQFVRVLGTSRADSMTVRGAQPTTWAVIATWPDEAAARRFEDGAYIGRWARRSAEAGRMLLAPSASRGRWGGRNPFDASSRRQTGSSPSSEAPEPVAAITRARIAIATTRRFWAAVPPVAAQLAPAPGRRAAIGMGEAPMLWQGTLSLWDDAASLRAFAYGPGAHAAALGAAPPGGWFAEELFARFHVLEASGTIGGAALSQPSAAAATASAPSNAKGRAA